MQSSDYLTVIECHEEKSVNEVYQQMSTALGACTGLRQGLHCMQRHMSTFVPCITDEYARLRYLSFFMKKILPDLEINYSMESDDISAHSGIEYACTNELKNLLSLCSGISIAELLSKGGTELWTFSALCAVAALPMPVDISDLIKTAGRSLYIDSLLGHVIRSRISDWDPEQFVIALREWHRGNRENDNILKFVLDTAAEHVVPVLTEGETRRLLNQYEGNEPITLALLRYMGELGFRELLPELYKMLERDDNTFSVWFSLVDTLTQLGDRREMGALESIKNTAKKSKGPYAKPLLQLVDASMQELQHRNRGALNAAVGHSLVQCMFYGDLQQPGKGGGGGLTTFLSNLGNSLSEKKSWDTVYTLVLLPLVKLESEKALIETLSANHYLVRVPVSLQPHYLAHHLASHEFEILRAVRRTLDRYRIDPDIFHIRFSDNASMGVAALARGLGIKVVFTLTPDPHRNFVDREGKLVSLSDDETLRNMNRVVIADRLIENADGHVLIGHNRRNDRIMPYFPQLWLESDTRKKPLSIIAEGVRTSFSYLEGATALSYLDLVANHSARYRLNRAELYRPVILNVGRLDPLKGQHHLLEVWIQSQFCKHYNLVFIGGNIDRPDPIESWMLQQFDLLMKNNPELIGRFSHIPALSNPEVRLLEQSITACIRGPKPNVYMCSSFKEEFGIAIIEAMCSGFLVIAPINGGVSSYIESGSNGFLIYNTDTTTMKQGMEEVLDHAVYDSKELHDIAQRGREFVTETFNIKRIADEFSDYYLSLFENEN